MHEELFYFMEIFPYTVGAPDVVPFSKHFQESADEIVAIEFCGEFPGQLRCFGPCFLFSDFSEQIPVSAAANFIYSRNDAAFYLAAHIFADLLEGFEFMRGDN
jgi:hypothetical protein